METLPEEVKINILEYLNANELSALSNTNNQYRRLSYDENLWRRIVKDEFDNIPLFCNSWLNTYKIGRFYSKIYNVSFMDVFNGNDFGVLGLYTNPKDIALTVASFLASNNRISDLVFGYIEENEDVFNIDPDNYESNIIRYVSTNGRLPDHNNTNIYIKLLNDAILNIIENNQNTGNYYHSYDYIKYFNGKVMSNTKNTTHNNVVDWDEGDYIIKIYTQSIIY